MGKICNYWYRYRYQRKVSILFPSLVWTCKQMNPKSLMTVYWYLYLLYLSASYVKNFQGENLSKMVIQKVSWLTSTKNWKNKAKNLEKFIYILLKVQSSFLHNHGIARGTSHIRWPINLFPPCTSSPPTSRAEQLACGSSSTWLLPSLSIRTQCFTLEYNITLFSPFSYGPSTLVQSALQWQFDAIWRPCQPAHSPNLYILERSESRSMTTVTHTHQKIVFLIIKKKKRENWKNNYKTLTKLYKLWRHIGWITWNFEIISGKF